MIEEVTNPKRKALRINLDQTIYGSFAEIGAGQDVARRFFEAGGASGTIAKTISAYDMLVSDTMYGKTTSKRYVSMERLKKMLKTEYESVCKLLGDQRGEETRFFAFANTVSAINYHKTNDPHGWMGVRFQTAPGAPYSEVILHVRLLENDYFLQQRTVGILGVNLVYACFNHFNDPVKFIQSLTDYLSPDQVEVDMMEFCNDKTCIDNRLLSLLLVKYGLTKAVMFDRNMKVMQPSDMLYKKDVLVLRGSFRPPTYVEFDMLKVGSGMFKKLETFDKKKYMVLCELTLDNIMDNGSFSANDYLNRVDLLCGMGVNVMISNYREFYKLSQFFSRIRINSLNYVIGMQTLIDVFDEKFYDHLKGGLLEAVGYIFNANTRLFAYPTQVGKKKELINSEYFMDKEPLNYLIKYLKESGKLIDIEKVRTDILHIHSRDVYSLIKKNKPEWEELVPAFIAKAIKEKWMFGFRKKITPPGLGSLKI